MVKLSASRISAYLSCSFKAWSTYHNNFPRVGGDGTKLGSTTHYILECLINPKRRDWGKEIIKHGSAFCIPAIKKLAVNHLKKFGVLTEENLAKIDGFIIVALKNDFYCDGAKEVISEKEFHIKNDKFEIGGFIDQLAIYDDKVVVVDFKSSKAKPTGASSDEYFNLQGLIYEWAVKKEYNLPVEVIFRYLKFKKACTVKSPPSPTHLLLGLESWLEYIGDYINKFSDDDKFSNLAYSNGNRFSAGGCGGVCGETKKDGSDALVCEVKYPRIFFVLKNETGKVIKSAFTKKELEKDFKDGYNIELRNSPGCPAWKKVWDKND